MQVLEMLQNLTVWQQGARRAPHKPLLVLWALARLQQGKPRLATFSEIEQDVGRLLQLAVPRATQVSYPFWNLRNDGVWQVLGAEGLVLRGGNKEPLLGELRKPQVMGGLSPDVDSWLRAHPEEIVRAARLLLDAHFPPSLHDDLCSELGLSIEEPLAGNQNAVSRRDPAFRSQVLLAYEYRCAVCGYDGRLDASHVGLEAAHVQWHKARGPDRVDNALALCSMHHKLFDVGAFSLTPDHRVVVADSFLGGQDAEYWVLRYHGQGLRGPRADKPRVAEVHRAWHWEQVFRNPPRLL